STRAFREEVQEDALEEVLPAPPAPFAATAAALAPAAFGLAFVRDFVLEEAVSGPGTGWADREREVGAGIRLRYHPASGESWPASKGSVDRAVQGAGQIHRQFQVPANFAACGAATPRGSQSAAASHRKFAR